MASDTEALAYALAIGAALYVYSDAKRVLAQPPISPNQAASLLTKGGYSVKRPTDNEVRVEIPGGYVSWTGDANLRRWETALIAADRFVPGTWLSRSVLQ